MSPSVKNQARWVRLLISEMERVFSATQDTNFNLIVTDFSSTDMDVEKALQKSSLPMYVFNFYPDSKLVKLIKWDMYVLRANYACEIHQVQVREAKRILSARFWFASRCRPHKSEYCSITLY